MDLDDIKVPPLFRLSLVCEAFSGTRCAKWVRARMDQIGALQVGEPVNPGGRRSFLVRGEKLREHYPDVHQSCVNHFVAEALKRSA